MVQSPRRERLRATGPLVRVLSAQILAFGVSLAAGFAASLIFGTRPPLVAMIGTQCIGASVLSYLFGLRGWWLGVQFVLPIVAWAFLALSLPSWPFLLAFTGLWLVYSNVSSERVPLYLSNRTTWAALSQMIASEAQQADAPGDTKPNFIDLGCGVGGTLAYLSKAHPDWRFVGVENAPGPFLVSWLRLHGRNNARVEFKSLWDVSLGDYDIAYAFLSPAPMPRLIARAQADMKPGALLVSNSFWAPDLPYDGIAEVNDERATALFFKRI
ncbi:class I SAM-dependent methyltransferase [Magnetovibrio sp.]|uniref:class I SAM-dependent methyltransferase n=1 Tax=Magnetovibrio sp. TaxID=2024836 RepID=UPI002F92B197